MSSFIRNKWKSNVVEPDPVQPTNIFDEYASLFSETNNNNNMFRNFNFTWDNAFLFLLWVSTTLLIVVSTIFILSDKNTSKYSLSESFGNLTIIKEINWNTDEHIKLDRNISYWDAIKMVDSLNKTLK